MNLTPPDGDDWLGLSGSPLPVGQALAWAGSPDCGAVVLFSGLVRDHSPDRPGVTSLDYEAYDEQVVPTLATISSEARTRWPGLRRVAMLHRTGTLAVGEPAVVVVVSAPHRAEAFDAGRFCIDTLKASAPIWKRETWDSGSDWSPGAEVEAVIGS